MKYIDSEKLIAEIERRMENSYAATAIKSNFIQSTNFNNSYVFVDLINLLIILKFRKNKETSKYLYEFCYI